MTKSCDTCRHFYIGAAPGCSYLYFCSSQSAWAMREDLKPARPAAAEKVAASDTQIGGDHYKTLKIQPITYIMANQIPFSEGNVIKYVTRWRSKNGVQDLKKARHMLDLLIEDAEKNGP